MNNTPRIYVACLASYNAGILHGDWIDLDGTEDIWKPISEILKQSSIEEAEEWAVHDHEYCGELGEYPGMETLNAIKQTYEMVESENLDWELFCDFCSHTGSDINPDQVEVFNSSFAGSDTSLLNWCHGFLDDTGQLESIPENLRFYFDYEAFARDLEMSGDLFVIEYNGNTHVFWNH